MQGDTVDFRQTLSKTVGQQRISFLDGRKTVTRRVIKLQPPKIHPYPIDEMPEWFFADGTADVDDIDFWPTYKKGILCPYGVPGDRLWVKEAHYLYGYWRFW